MSEQFYWGKADQPTPIPPHIEPLDVEAVAGWGFKTFGPEIMRDFEKKRPLLRPRVCSLYPKPEIKPGEQSSG